MCLFHQPSANRPPILSIYPIFPSVREYAVFFHP